MNACSHFFMLFIRVRQNGTSVTPRYGVVAKMVYYIYDDTWYLAKYAHNGHMGICEKYGQVGYPRKEHQKCNSETLTSGP